MNFLAHLHLADPEPGLMLGGIAPISRSRAELAALPPEVQDGVRLHRLIDALHRFAPGRSRASVARSREEYHWFSGIIIDIYYDHILAREWGRYSLETTRELRGPRRTSCSGTHSSRTHPPEAAEFIRWMIEDDRLVRYSTREGIEDTLARLSRRIARRMPRRPRCNSIARCRSSTRAGLATGGRLSPLLSGTAEFAPKARSEIDAACEPACRVLVSCPA